MAEARLHPYKDRVKLMQANFANIRAVLDECRLERVDGVFADLGVLRTHLDEGKRGFSYRNFGPVDMRYDAHVRVFAFARLRAVRGFPFGTLMQLCPRGERRTRICPLRATS